MKQSFKLSLIMLVVLGLLAGGVAIYSSAVSGVSAAEGGSPVFDFQDHGGVIVMNPKTRGTSDLVRSVDGISINIDTSDLPVGAYTTWWIIFNDPSGCSDGACGENDVLPPPGTTAAKVSVLWATGGIVGPDRMGHFSASLGVGADAAPGQLLFGDGLTNPMGAEVHMAVRYHGPVRWDDPTLFHDQLYSVAGFCTPRSSLGMGTDLMAFDCFDPQATIHLAPAGSMSP